MLATFLFFLLATVAIAAALGMLLSRNPVSSALWLILNMFCIAGLYLTLNAQFIAVIQVLVYAGAIMVLFLFVIMLLNLAETPSLEYTDWKKGAGFILGVGILAQLAYIVAMSTGTLPDMASLEQTVMTGSPKAIARALFTHYAIAVQVIGVLLLVATIGAVMIAKRRFI
ncbi:MAG: NADH-quinone oxidoreductase subunit J [Rhodothermales bacterium]